LILKTFYQHARHDLSKQFFPADFLPVFLSTRVRDHSAYSGLFLPPRNKLLTAGSQAG